MMRYAFNALFICVFLVFSFKIDAQTVDQSVNWDSTLSSCTREQDVHEKAIVDAAKKFAGRAVSPFNTKYVLDRLKTSYYPSRILVDSLNRGISDVKRKLAEAPSSSAGIDHISELQLTECLLRAGLQQASQSGATSSGQQQVPARNINQEEVARGDVNRSIALAQQNQARGEEQARKKGRKEHRPDLDAKDCLQLNPDTRMLRNACSYKIEVTYCALGPKPANNNNFDVTWAFSCTEGKGRFGADTVGAGKDLFGLFPHRTYGGLFVAACREEYPKDVKFSGSEITYQCRPI